MMQEELKMTKKEKILMKFYHSDQQSSTSASVMSQLPHAFPRENSQKFEKLF